ncbi:hypothetical protein Gohar_025302 [Gossypium harknessii]|uniref:Uncharacterized protein n=1 Tax=Gossypium harknessii TaxID=34285 RepID=A0A7J9HIM5_9ROSI|nr:hypothetical protein [Gossypium harknessii]
MEPKEEEDRDLQLSLKTLELYELYALRDLPQLLLQGSCSTCSHYELVGVQNCPFYQRGY